MDITDFWLIHKPSLDMLEKFVAQAPSAVMTRDGKRVDGARTMTMRGSVAVIPVQGTIFPRATGLTDYLGEFISVTTVDTVAKDLRAALDNPQVTGVVLDVNSPGGQVAGVNELADIIFAADKPVVAYVNGMAASAAYWIASAADEMVLDATAMAGSIGTVFSFDLPGESMGKYVRTVEIVSTQSPLKRADPTTEEGRQEWQRLADELATVFIEQVARNRGVTADAVMNDFGRGSMKVGAAAVAAGMADRIDSMEQVISQMEARKKTMPMRMSAQEISMAETSLFARLKAALIGGEPAEEDVTPEAADQLLAELGRLRAENAAAQELLAKQKEDAEAQAKAAETERAERISAEVAAFMAQHGERLGKETAEALEMLYRNAKESDSADAIAQIERIAPSLRDGGPTERKTVTDEAKAKVEAELAAVTSETEPMTEAEIGRLAAERTQAAGIKPGSPKWQSAYMAEFDRLKKGGANG